MSLPDLPDSSVVDNPWQQLRQFTAARIALGRTGVSLPTVPQLAFQLAHARARDAVHLPLDVEQLLAALAAASGGNVHADAAGSGEASGGATVALALDETLVLDSAAGDRLIYLQRPDLGRRLSDDSRRVLEERARNMVPRSSDLAVVIADGLSPQALARNAAPFLSALIRRIKPEGWSLAPLAIVRQARVAIGDEIAQLLQAKMVVVMIGERPGLSSPDSMGLYLTWMPQLGVTDANRNCISNIRPTGMDAETAAYKLHYLLGEAFRRRLSGVKLKDESSDRLLPQEGRVGSFLLLDK